MKQKKDVLFMSQFFYPEYVASSSLASDTAFAVARAGFSVEALCGFPREYAPEGDFSRRENVRGVEVFRVKYLQANRKKFWGRLINYFSLTLAMFFHIFRLKNAKTVVVYSNPPVLPLVAAVARRLFKIKLVFVAHDIYPEMAIRTGTAKEKSLICRVMNLVNRLVYSRADKIVALSSEMRDFILENRNVDPEKVEIIPNWYVGGGDESFAPAENRFLSLGAGRFTVAYFGNMGTAQDMDTVSRALEILKDDPNVFFLFGGYGNKKANIEGFIRDKNINNALVTEYLFGRDFEAALASADCAIVSLEKNLCGLGVPSKTYSYMHCGIPIVAIMDDCDIVRDALSGAGVWVKNGDGEGLARVILDMLSNRESTAKMGKRSREIYLEKYTLENSAEKYIKLIQALEECED